MRFLILMPTTIIASGNAYGQPQNVDVTETFSSSYQACITHGETHNTTAVPAAECNARELRMQDARLNKTYREATVRLSPARGDSLRADERNWIVARDQKCSRRPDAALRTECKIGETIRRIAYLERVR